MKKNLNYKIILLLATFYFLFSISAASAASLFFEPTLTEVGLNQGFDVILRLDPQNQSVNAVEGMINFSDNLSLQSLNDGNSIIDFWIERPKAGSEGVSFSGVMPGGYEGDLSPYWQGYKPGKIMRLTFKARQEGPAQINLENFRVLLNDGSGTEAPLSTPDLRFNVRVGAVSPGITAKKDTTPPEPFSPQIVRDPNIFDNQFSLVFRAEDLDSGIDRYEIRERRQERDWRGLFEKEILVQAESPYLLKDQGLKSYIEVKAVDRAGNERVAELEPRNHIPWYENYLDWVIIIVFGLVVLIFLYGRRERRGKIEK